MRPTTDKDLLVSDYHDAILSFGLPGMSFPLRPSEAYMRAIINRLIGGARRRLKEEGSMFGKDRMRREEKPRRE